MKNLPLILIIDDVAENIQVLAAALPDLYEVQFATSGPEGLQKVQQQRPDVILLDVMMPVMDGMEVLAELKANPLSESIPVILVTARTDPDSEAASFAAGAADFVHKPINPLVVRARVSQQLSVVQQQDQLERLVRERTAELAAERDRAQSASRAKSAFLANMNHELRTPLNHILGMVGIAQRRSAEPTTKEMLGKALVSTKSLHAMLEDLISVAEIDADELKLTLTPFSLEELLDEVIDHKRAAAQAKGIHVRHSIQPGMPTNFIGAAKHMAKVLDLLLGNALKFSQAGEIELVVTATASQVSAVALRFEVRDQGLGVDPSVKDQIFELFEQADATSTRKHGGIGLGLSLCKRLVALMAGTMGLSSELGQGSTFWLTVNLPIQKSDFGADAKSVLLNPEEKQRLITQAQTIEGLLARDDFYAIVVHLEDREALRPLLMEDFQAYCSAMENAEFDKALVPLRACLEFAQ
jgi:signal transduction histidine kinase